MTKQIEDLLNLPRLDEALAALEEMENENADESTNITVMDDEDPKTSKQFVDLLEQNRNLERILHDPEGLDDHQREMNEVYEQALRSHREMLDLGFNVDPKNAGEIFSPAVAMLKVAVDASKSKADQKLKLMKVRMDREKLDIEKGKADPNIVDGETGKPLTGGVFEHKDLLAQLRQKVKK